MAEMLNITDEKEKQKLPALSKKKKRKNCSDQIFPGNLGNKV